MREMSRSRNITRVSLLSKINRLLRVHCENAAHAKRMLRAAVCVRTNPKIQVSEFDIAFTRLCAVVCNGSEARNRPREDI